jgi:hypothetical protein
MEALASPRGIFCIQVYVPTLALGLPRYRIGMTITKRLTALIASGLALAAAPDADAWKPRRSASSHAPDAPATSAPPQPLPDEPKPGIPALPPVALTPRQLAVFASGLLITAAMVAGAWVLWGSDSSLVPRKSKTSVPAPQPAALASGQITACPLQPAAAAAGAKDGHFPLQAGVAGLQAADIASFMVIGKEAAAAGRPRDAEVAFLMACQVADQLKGAGSLESAEARYQLGSHYAQLAQAGRSGAAANRAELLRRAERLYADSLQPYTAHYGQIHEKPQLAAQGLAAVRQQLAQAENVQPASVSVAAPQTAPSTEGPEPRPRPALAGPAAALSASPLPATDAEVRPRRDRSVLKECPEAVATLGLCNPGN